MTHTFRTAMVGLGRSDVVALRQIFQTIFRDDPYQFDWVTADEPQLDILLVNSFFTASTGIQKIMRQDQVSCLIVDHEPNTLSITEDSMHLPIRETDSIVEWFNQVVLPNKQMVAGEQIAAATPKPKPEPVPPPERPVPVASAPVSKLPPAPPVSKVVPANNPSGQSIRDIINTVLGKKTGVWALHDQQGLNLAVVDIPQQLAWVMPDYQQHKSRVRLPLSLSSDYQPPASFMARDLKQWLWQLAWDMEGESALLDKHTVYVLKNWPQPSAANQKTLLQACAYLKNKPASAEQLGRDLRLPLTDIQRLFTACFAVGFADEFNRDIHGAMQVASSASVEQAQPTEQGSFLRGFLSKFRQKLGL